MMKDIFMSKNTYILGMLMGVFFSFIGTAVFIPTYLDRAIVLNEVATLPPPISFIFFLIEIVTVYLGIIVGVLLVRKLVRRRPVMIYSGLLGGFLAVVPHLPVLNEITMLGSIFKIITMFFLCICLTAWTFVISEINPERPGMQIGAIISVSSIIGCFVPLIQGYLLSIGAFEIGWLASSIMVIFMGVCGYLSPETGIIETIVEY